MTGTTVFALESGAGRVGGVIGLVGVDVDVDGSEGVVGVETGVLPDGEEYGHPGACIELG
jgi:hypothetical protein